VLYYCGRYLQSPIYIASHSGLSIVRRRRLGIFSVFVCLLQETGSTGNQNPKDLKMHYSMIRRVLCVSSAFYVLLDMRRNSIDGRQHAETPAMAD
jgi:hypothetical protein